ncbi:MAG: hypothetical protein WC006_00355 [Bacilli bacterium]
MKKEFSKFTKTGSITDYLDYKKSKKQQMEVSKELSIGEKNEIKRGNNSKKP